MQHHVYRNKYAKVCSKVQGLSAAVWQQELEFVVHNVQCHVMGGHALTIFFATSFYSSVSLED